MAKRIFKFRHEVVEEIIKFRGGIFPTTWNGRRIWVYPFEEEGEEVAILDFRLKNEKLPRGSAPLYAFGGNIYGGNWFRIEEVERFILAYNLEQHCVFEIERVAAENFGEVPIEWHFRLYGMDGRLPPRYNIDETFGGLLKIPLIGGGFEEVEQGEEFVAGPKGSRHRGRWTRRSYKAAIQETDGWIDFRYPIE